MNNKICIGLFGTCGNSKWRDPFIEQFEKHDMKYFNPDAGDNWHPGMIDDENRHLMEDQIILFPVLAETTGFGSLGEIGFSVMNSMRNIKRGSGQYLVVLIENDCTDERATENERKHSINTRKLVKSKLLNVNHPNIIVVKNEVDMLFAALRLRVVIKDLQKVHSFNIALDA